MPVFAYFAVMAPVLLGLLCLVEAVVGPPGPMPLTTGATGLPVAYIAPKPNPVLTVREGIVAEVPKGQEGYALSSTNSAAAVPPTKQAGKTKVAKASSKKKQQQQQVAQFGWQQNQQFGGGWEQQRNGWDQQQKRSSRNANNRNGQDRNNQAGRYAMSGQQNFFSPFGTIR